ncbi:class B sortase [Marinilactibacillus kalidii]|uniref:class B sortase n=1 Tax=Marinilactibacillus kalidii TaxID=2820274 RepID=UPI001ABEB45C|nr:class B sortase [Marinilactibacillus kalidii]
MMRKGLLRFLGSLFIVLVGYYVYTVIPQMQAVSVPAVETPSQIKKVADLHEPSNPAATKKGNKVYAIEENPYADYYKLNSDYTGWLKVNQTNIDYPVVRGEDNAYYLSHNFYKESDVLGAIFMDYRNVGMGYDENLILYGHYNTHNQMFADLEKYLEKSFLKENPTITFHDPYTERIYEIISVHVAPAESTYIQTSFEADEFEQYYNKVKSESMHEIDSAFEPEDRLLTLITCNYGVEDGRLYIHAREIK